MKAFLTVVVALAASLVLTAQNGTSIKDPSVGTWRINLQKSTYSPGPAPKTPTLRRYELRPDGFTVITQTSVDAQGNPTFTQAAYKPDGKEYPVYDQNTMAAMLTGGAKPKATT